MSVGSVGSSGSLPLAVVVPSGRIADPQEQRAQVNAQADLLQALRGVDLPTKMALAKLSGGPGLDLYA